MADFKSTILKDIDIFLNEKEFVDIHFINGVAIKCLLDDVLSRTNSAGAKDEAYSERYRDGTYYDYETLFVKKEDFGNAPRVGTLLTIDKEQYIVKKTVDNLGVYEILLSRNTY